MRDFNRIALYTEQLRKQWERVPDWRFGQLIANTLGNVLVEANCSDIFILEDDEFFEAFEKVMDSILK
jgi:hypothetical protein